MLSKSVREIVRDRLLAGGPQITDDNHRRHYVDSVLDELTRDELLTMISDAIEMRLVNLDTLRRLTQ